MRLTRVLSFPLDLHPPSFPSSSRTRYVELGAAPHRPKYRFWKDEETRDAKAAREGEGRDTDYGEEDAARTGFLLLSRLSKGFPLLSRTPLGCYCLFSSDFIFFFFSSSLFFPSFLFSLGRQVLYLSYLRSRNFEAILAQRISQKRYLSRGDFLYFRRRASSNVRTLHLRKKILAIRTRGITCSKNIA